MIKFRPRNFLHNQETTWLVLDLAMLGLLVINLAWLILDWLYASTWFPPLVSRLLPVIGDYYAAHIDPVFWLIDLAFVAVFLSEFVLRWAIAVRRKIYDRWYHYPFLHWYEVLGCLPLAGFRALRFLRILSMVYRLQKLGVIDLADTAPARLVARYYAILVEEVADRVVVNVLDGVQAELRADQPVVRRIVNDVVLKRRGDLVEALGRRLELLVDEAYGDHRADVSVYVDNLITKAVEESQDVKRLQLIPVFGAYGTRLLERTIAQIVFAVIDGAAADLQSERNRAFVEDLLSSTLDQLLQHDEQFDEVTNQMLIDAIDLIKSQVQVQRWRQEHPADEGSPPATPAPVTPVAPDPR
ncbi:MAG: hypothetical protein AAF184_11960 [Pseudomonadota bacterium]